jgi:hypothetical protein
MAGRPTLEAPHRVGLMPKTVRQEQVPWKTADLVQNASLQQPRACHHDCDTDRPASKRWMTSRGPWRTPL